MIYESKKYLRNNLQMIGTAFLGQIIISDRLGHVSWDPLDTENHSCHIDLPNRS